jgi:hypothetical protein
MQLRRRPSTEVLDEQPSDGDAERGGSGDRRLTNLADSTVTGNDALNREKHTCQRLSRSAQHLIRGEGGWWLGRGGASARLISSG